VRTDLRLSSPTFIGQNGVELRIGASFKMPLGFRFAPPHFSRRRVSHNSPAFVASGVNASYGAAVRRARGEAPKMGVVHKNLEFCTLTHINPRNPQRDKAVRFPGRLCLRENRYARVWPSHRRPRWRRTSQALLPRASRRSPVFVSSDVLAA
jgi:hypothetical protein